MGTGVWRWIVAVPGAALTVALVGWYLHHLDCTPLEAGRLLLGLVLFWGPLGALLYALLPAAVEERSSRFALAWGASYALTTLAYFGCAVLGLTVLFYVLQGAALLAALLLFYRAWRQRAVRPVASWGGFDWGLIVLIGLSLACNVRYQEAFQTTEEGGKTHYTYLQFGDQLYHVAQAYELSRHIPPQQAMIRGATPERAYHNFPHITLMLLARYTHQHDMLRAQLFYHYAVIEVLFCLCLFGIGRTITGARWPGYLAVLLMYVVVLDGTPIKSNQMPCFYFTLFPHISSGLEPVAATSPQMYSGLAVLFAVLLGLALFCKARAAGRPFGWLLCVLTLMTAASLRFRIHVFLVLFPLCLLALLLLWKRTRSWLPPVLAVVAVLISALLYCEMKGPQYLPGTAKLDIRYNGLTSSFPWITQWPLSGAAKACVDDITTDPEIHKWLWQAVAMSGFCLFDMIGLPMLVGTLLVVCSPRIRQQYGWFLFAVLAMTVLSIAGGVLLNTDYDNYSVGGQLLFHTHWYIFALVPIPLWLIYRHLRDRWAWPAWALGPAAVLVVAALVVSRISHPSQVWWADRWEVSADERLALYYLHETAPADAIILANRLPEKQFFGLSGVTGRAAYLEFAGNPVDQWARKFNSQDDRLGRIKELWTLHDPTRFREVLRQTHATILLEYADNPLVIEGGRPGLTLIWRSPNQFVTVYRIDP